MSIKNHRLQVWVTEGQLAHWRATAAAQGTSLSAWVSRHLDRAATREGPSTAASPGRALRQALGVSLQLHPTDRGWGE